MHVGDAIDGDAIVGGNVADDVATVNAMVLFDGDCGSDDNDGKDTVPADDEDSIATATGVDDDADADAVCSPSR